MNWLMRGIYWNHWHSITNRTAALLCDIICYGQPQLTWETFLFPWMYKMRIYYDNSASQNSIFIHFSILHHEIVLNVCFIDTVLVKNANIFVYYVCLFLFNIFVYNVYCWLIKCIPEPASVCLNKLNLPRRAIQIYTRVIPSNLPIFCCMIFCIAIPEHKE